MLLTSRTSYPLETSYLYDTANRLTEVRYPAQYGMSGNPRKTVNVTYDQTSRLNDLKVSGVTQMDQIAYNDYGQATSIRIGGGSANPLTEQYSFDANTGLMTNQKVKRGATSLMDLSYNYARGNSKGSLSGTTGNLTNVVNNLDRNKDRKFEFDSLGRLTKALGGVAAGGSGVANWTQTYTFDRYGNKLTTAKSGITANSAAIPLDGLASQTYAAATNRITNSGTEYDNAGNQTRGASPAGTLQRFEFDEAGRIKVIKTDAGAAIETNTYATSRERLIKETSTDRTYYAWGGSSVLAEYTEAIASSTPAWAKSYIYAGSRLLSTITKNGSAELTEYHHPDRLGTKAVSDTTANTFKEQATLPFGTEIPAETVATSNQRFTSYDRSGATGLDYAVNRTYNSGQSRFTTVDPIGIASVEIGDPQSMNLFAYTQNNPVDFADPNGLESYAPDFWDWLHEKGIIYGGNGNDLYGNDVDIIGLSLEYFEGLFDDCAKLLADFFGDPGSYFFIDDPGIVDTALGGTRGGQFSQNHFYNSPTGYGKNSSFYVPNNAEVRLNPNDDDNIVRAYLKDLNVTIHALHLLDVSKGVDGKDGRKKIGELGYGAGGKHTPVLSRKVITTTKDGKPYQTLDITYGDPFPHGHVDLYDGNKLYGSRKNLKRISFTELCNRIKNRKP